MGVSSFDETVKRALEGDSAALQRLPEEVGRYLKLVRDVLRQDAKPVWKQEPPTVAGWYWVRGAYAVDKIVEVTANMWNDGFTVWYGRECDALDNDDYDGAEWCGPIVPPEG